MGSNLVFAQPTHSNQLKWSADQHALVVDEYLAIEVSQGRVAGPFDFLSLPNL